MCLIAAEPNEAALNGALRKCHCRYYPLFYSVQSCVMNGACTRELVSEGLQRYQTNITTDMVNCWKLWVPAQLINFSVVPVHMRVPFAAGVSFVWSCVFSALRGDMKQVKCDTPVAASATASVPVA